MMSLSLFALLQITCGGAEPLAPPDLDGNPFIGVPEDAFFGEALAMEGELAVVGAPLDDYADGTSGGAWVYRRTNFGWELEQTLVPESDPLGVRFGSAVAIDGDAERILVGDWSISSAASIHSGGARVFERVAGTWQQVAFLEGATGGQYGKQVALDGDVAALSGTDPFDPVRIYERSAGVWSLVSTVGGGLSGLVLDGDRLAVTYPSTTPDGRVSFFQRGAQGWEFEDVISPPEPYYGEFGSSVDLSGDTAVVGERLGMGNGVQSGAVHVFERTESGWIVVQTLAEDPIGYGGYFGADVALSGSRLLVGHPISGIYGNELFPQQIHVYERSDGGDFERVRGIVSPFGLERTGFGQTVALSGDQALVGASQADVGFLNSGEAWVFDASSLASGPASVSLAAGGSVELDLFAGDFQSGSIYLVLGSASGVSPGTEVNGVGIPLNPDFYTTLLLGPANLLVTGFGVLDAQGCASAALVVPAGAPASLVGTTLHHAYVALDPTTLDVLFSSEAEPLQLGM